MSEELSVSTGLRFVKGERELEKSYAGVMLDVSGSNYFQGNQTILTSATVVNIGAVASIGYILAKNLDSTNYVSFHNGSGGALTVELPPKGSALFKLATSGTLYATANTATVEIEYTVISA